eukprot:2587280-Rhodomonas_salina.1
MSVLGLVVPYAHVGELVTGSSSTWSARLTNQVALAVVGVVDRHLHVRGGGREDERGKEWGTASARTWKGEREKRRQSAHGRVMQS